MGNRNSNHYDRKLEGILHQAAAVFCARGYHQASMRDIARATGVSLAGLYYYFSSKQDLLYRIQRHTFEAILAAAKNAVLPLRHPEDRLRALICQHLQFSLARPDEMKVLIHEDRSLDEARRREVSAIKKAYYRLCFEQVAALGQKSKLAASNTRVAVLGLFGMMNWIYAWYNPKIDPEAGALAGQMTEIFLRGLYGAAVKRPARSRARE